MDVFGEPLSTLPRPPSELQVLEDAAEGGMKKQERESKDTWEVPPLSEY